MRFRPLWIGAAALLMAAPLPAATVEALSLAELVHRSERVAEMRVVSVTAVRDGRGRPATEVVLRTLTPLKGDAAESVTMRLPGGAFGADRLVVPGMPLFAPGEEIVLFLSAPSSAGTRVPIGLGQGVYRARIDAKGARTRLAPDLAGLTLVDRATGKAVERRAESVDREAFLNEVRRCVSGR